MARTPVTPATDDTRWMLGGDPPGPVTFDESPVVELRRTSSDPSQLRGKSDTGQVRPADDRYLTDAQVEARDGYVAEETGPDAQQLALRRAEVSEVIDGLDPAALSVIGQTVTAGRLDVDPDEPVAADAIVDALLDMPRGDADTFLALAADVTATPADPTP